MRLQHQCLVLNKNWQPIRIIPLQRAIKILFSTYTNGEPKARIIDPENYTLFSWNEWSQLDVLTTDKTIRSSRAIFKVPELIILSSYDQFLQPKIKFSKRALFKRDGLICQFCGKQFPRSNLTVEHILARCRGGGTSYENCVVACKNCNSKKGNKLLSETNMALIRQPKKPEIKLFDFETIPLASWTPFLINN